MPHSRPSKQTAQRHERVRRQHSDELAQDYVEAIREMQVRGERARITDLQAIFGVSHVSVIRALRRFEERGLLERTPEDGLQLTSEGENMAAQSAERHELVVEFLLALGVTKGQAEADAEGIEHHLSRESLEAFRRLVKRREKR